MEKTKRYRTVYVIDHFIEDDFDYMTESVDEHNQAMFAKAKIKSEQLKKKIEELGSSEEFNGIIVQINSVFENKFGQLS